MQRPMVALALGLLAVGLAIGGAAGYVAGLSEMAETDSATFAAGGARRDAAPDGSHDVGPDDAASPGASRVPRARASSQDGEFGGPGASAGPGAPADGTITGRVAGPDGAPLAGVLIRANPDDRQWDDPSEDPGPRLPAGSPPPRLDIERTVRQFAARLRRGEAAVREATTDASGAYALRGLTDAPHNVQAWLAGYRITPSPEAGWRPVAIGGRRDFKAVPLEGVTVSVLLPDGTHPATASLSWKPAGGGEDGAALWNAKSPDIEIEPGTYEISATSGLQNDRRRMWHHGFDDDEDEGALYRSEAQTLTVARGTAQTVTLRLAGRPGIVARVVFDGAAHPRAARVAVVSLADGGAPDPARLLGNGDGVRSKWLDAEDPNAAFTKLEPGPYLVGVTFRGGILGPSAAVTVGEALVTQELRVPDGEIRDWVKVWVRAPDGRLLTDATLECCGAGPDGSGRMSTDATPESDGSYRVEHWEMNAPSSSSSSSSGSQDRGAPRTWSVRATSASFGSGKAAYDAATDREVTIRLAEPARLRAVISGYAGGPHEGRVSLALEYTGDDDDTRGSASPSAAIDGAGRATFAPVNPGPYALVVRLSRDAEKPGTHGRWRGWGDGDEVARIPLTLHAGANDTTVDVPSTTSFVVTIDPAVVAAELQIQRFHTEGVPELVARASPEDGSREIRFTDVAIAPGRYRLVVARVGDMWVDLPAGGTIAFRPRPFDALQIRDANDAAWLGELGLQTGDVIVAIDGTMLENVLQTDAAIAVAKTRPTAKFTVRRGERRFEVVADARKLTEAVYLAPWVR